MCKCKSPLQGPRNYVDRTWKLSANYSARTFPCYISRQTKNPLAIDVWKTWVTDWRWKLQGDVLHGILAKNTVPTCVTYSAFIALQNFHPTMVSNIFANSQTTFRFRFFSKKNKPKQSATIVLTLWICRTEDQLQSCILIWRDSKKRCVHCN